MAMAEYIEREAAAKAVRKAWAKGLEPSQYIEELPAADVVKVKHGCWFHDINNLYACSKCLGRETMSHRNPKPYCPNCGARMDGDD